MGYPNQLAGEVRPVERVGEEEPQRRHDAVHGWRRQARLALFDLEPAQVVGRGGVG
jgi:hypothetical protein